MQNEKRQGENQPYGRVFNVLFENIFPAGHPYSWSVIGSMEDLNAASLEDVREWFGQYYGASNAVLVIAGDVEAEDVRARVEHYFGHIPAGPPRTRQSEWIPELKGVHRLAMQDRVPQARLYKAWTMSRYGTLDSNRLDLVAGILSEGKTSRLYKRLVYDQRIASDVSAFAFPLEIAGVFGIVATAMPGHTLAELDAAIEEEVAMFLEAGPTPEELERVVASRRAAFIRGIERVGGFGGKSDLLARNETYLKDPAFHKTSVARWDAAAPEDLRVAANAWMKRGQVVLEVVPFPATSVTDAMADRSRLPDTGTPPAVGFERFERFTLGNGLNVVLAERHAIPVVELSLVVDAGFAADQFAAPGTASLALAMLREGTASRSSLEISDEPQTSRRDPGRGLRPRRILRRHVGAQGEPRGIAGSLCGCHPEPGVSATGFRAPPAIADRRHTAGEGAAADFGAQALPAHPVREGHAYSLPFTGSGDEAIRRRVAARGSGGVPQHLVQARKHYADRGGRCYPWRDGAVVERALPELAPGRCAGQESRHRRPPE